VRFWDAQTGAPTGLVVVTTTFVTSVSFSPDGDTVITGGWDGAISLVDVGDRSVIGQLPGPENTFNSVAFDPSGETAFVSYETGEAIAWSFDIDDWRDRACDVVNRPLTTEEWSRFIPDLDYEPVCDDVSR
jgi:WD40 repeat protein